MVMQEDPFKEFERIFSSFASAEEITGTPKDELAEDGNDNEPVLKPTVQFCLLQLTTILRPFGSQAIVWLDRRQ